MEKENELLRGESYTESDDITLVEGTMFSTYMYMYTVDPQLSRQVLSRVLDSELVWITAPVYPKTSQLLKCKNRLFKHFNNLYFDRTTLLHFHCTYCSSSNHSTDTKITVAEQETISCFSS